ncbi:uncharacterized protein LOC120317135 [Crotalus tigris]|uniref:uncharacterized protein LOC120317135 n=1 Tax=Crotalus tigris TaxID=88082 RepID=UPI00192FA24C|nr:uncharacterized protein LOC120317135 [Crotalus tigris]
MAVEDYCACVTGSRQVKFISLYGCYSCLRLHSEAFASKISSSKAKAKEILQNSANLLRPRDQASKSPLPASLQATWLQRPVFGRGFARLTAPSSPPPLQLPQPHHGQHPQWGQHHGRQLDHSPKAISTPTNSPWTSWWQRASFLSAAPLTTKWPATATTLALWSPMTTSRQGGKKRSPAELDPGEREPQGWCSCRPLWRARKPRVGQVGSRIRRGTWSPQSFNNSAVGTKKRWWLTGTMIDRQESGDDNKGFSPRIRR